MNNKGNTENNADFIMMEESFHGALHKISTALGTIHMIGANLNDFIQKLVDINKTPQIYDSLELKITKEQLQKLFDAIEHINVARVKIFEIITAIRNIKTSTINNLHNVIQETSRKLNNEIAIIKSATEEINSYLSTLLAGYNIAKEKNLIALSSREQRIIERLPESMADINEALASMNNQISAVQKKIAN